MNRNLDGIYFRVKRNNKFENVCFSDLTLEEIDEITNSIAYNRNWWKSVALHLKRRLNVIGETFDIVGAVDDD